MSEEHAHSSTGPLPVGPLPVGPLTFGPADALRISRLSGSELNDVGRATQRLARQAEARTVLLAFRIGESVADDMLIVTSTRPHTHHAADNAAIAEISLQLGISRSQARRYAVLGAQLADLPETSTAFLDGEIRMSRIELVAEALSALDSALRANAEPLAVELARRTSADLTLRDQLAELVIALDPEAAAEARRDFAERNQNIHIRPEVHGHVSIDGCLPAEQGVHLVTRISALVAERLWPRRLATRRSTPCRRFRRDPGSTGRTPHLRLRINALSGNTTRRRAARRSRRARVGPGPVESGRARTRSRRRGRYR